MPEAIKQGDILVSLWGYGQTRAMFFKVLKRTKYYVTVQKIETKSVCVGKFKGVPTHWTAEPSNIEDNHSVCWSGVIRRKIRYSEYKGECIDLASYNYAPSAWLWDGKPVSEEGQY